MKEGEYRVCQCCNGKKEFVWDDSSHETCVSEDQDGIYEEGRIHITARAMVKLRRSRWEEQVGWPEEERRYMGHEVLPEDRHGQPVPMVIVGTDVVSLYPNLKIKEVIKAVNKAIMKADVKWEDIDYLEAARYVALNWTDERCRASPLGRILPRRRGKTGSRPGLTGRGNIFGHNFFQNPKFFWPILGNF